MELKLEIYGALCSTSKFIVNGINAESSDFGTLRDDDMEGAEDYGCGDKRFTGDEATTKVLEIYNITKEEYIDKW